MEIDAFSKVFRQVLDSLILNSPFKTCMGTIAGFAVDGFSNLIPQAEPVSWYTWVCLFIFLSNATSLFGREKVSERSRRILLLIAKGRREGLISQEEARRRYRLVIEQEINRLEKESVEEKAQVNL